MKALRFALAVIATVVLALLGFLWLSSRELPRVREGEPLPSPRLDRIGRLGGTSFSDFRGRPLLAIVLDTECCAATASAADRLSRELARRGLAVMVVAVDADRSRIDGVVRQLGLTLPVAEDPGRERLGEAFGRGGLPQFYLTDRSGRVVFASIGPLDLEDAAFRARVEPLLSPDPW